MGPEPATHSRARYNITLVTEQLNIHSISSYRVTVQHVHTQYSTCLVCAAALKHRAEEERLKCPELMLQVERLGSRRE